MTTQPPTDVEPDPFETLGARFAYDYQEDGPREFKKLMAARVDTGKFPKEYMQGAAAENMAMGLPKSARVIAQAARQCPSLMDIRFCSYTTPPTGNILAHWQQRQQYRVNDMRERIEALLHKACLTLDWLDNC